MQSVAFSKKISILHKVRQASGPEMDCWKCIAVNENGYI